MHVIQLLHALFRGPDVEVVESCLPKRRAFRSLSKQVRLSRIALTALGPQGAGSSLFQNLHDLGRSSDFRFTQKQVDVLGHHDVSNDDEPVAQACLFQNGEEVVAALGGAESLFSPVTGTRDKVQVVRAVVAVEVARHNSEYRFEGVYSHPSKNEGWGTLCPG